MELSKEARVNERHIIQDKEVLTVESLGSRGMSLLEVARGLNEGKLKVTHVMRHKTGTHYVYVGLRTEIPDKYEIVNVSRKIVIYRLGTGGKRVMKTGKAAYLLVPKQADPKPGSALLELREDGTVILYIG